MTEEDSLLLDDLKANTQNLFNEFGRLENEKKNLEEQLAELEQKFEKLNREKSELRKKIDKLIIANQLLSQTEENRAAKMKINKLVREIDKCIALLNK